MCPPPTQSGPLCSMRGISKSFGGVSVLREVSLDLYEGQVHVLAGENGAGKSTLMKILAGVHGDFQGEIKLHGESVRFANIQEGQAAGIAVIHQEMSLVGPLSVADNVFLGREICRSGLVIDRAAQREMARQALGRVGVTIDVDRPVEDYPLALRQMIEIAKALAQEAKILVMDEPTSSLSDPEVDALFAVIADLQAAGCAIVYITHRMEEIYRVAQVITVLRDGELVQTSPVAEMPDAELVRRMVGREIVEQFPERVATPGAEILAVDELTVPDPAGGMALAISGLSLTLRRGEILGVAGLQGSGKSALLHGLFGDYGHLAEGRVKLAGREHRITSPARSIGAGMALLTNDRKENGLVLGMGIVENGTLASLPRHSPGLVLHRAGEERAIAAQVEALDIRAADLANPVVTMSGGNQQKVVFAKWLETSPRILLLDEPTRGVDVGAKHQIYELLNQWTRQGMAVLLVTSELPELLALSDRIIVLHRGHLTAELARAEFSPEAVLRAAMDETSEMEAVS